MRTMRNKEEKTMKLYTNTWTNTGMKHQVTWVFNTPTPNGTPEDHVGDYGAVSSDKQRYYLVKSYGVITKNFCYYADLEVDELGGETREEYKFDMEMLLHNFIIDCESVFNGNFAEVYFKDVAYNMMDMSEQLGLGWRMEELYDYVTHEAYWRVYSREFAEKAYIGEDAIFCFNEVSLVEAMREESISSYCDFKKHDVIMMYPDGSYDEDEAYVVIRNKLHVRLVEEDEIEEILEILDIELVEE